MELRQFSLSFPLVPCKFSRTKQGRVGDMKVGRFGIKQCHKAPRAGHLCLRLDSRTFMTWSPRSKA